MWVKNYSPSEKGWYLIKVNDVKIPALWNNANKFFVDITGKGYKVDVIDCWLDDSLCKTETL